MLCDDRRKHHSKQRDSQVQRPREGTRYIPRTLGS